MREEQHIHCTSLGWNWEVWCLEWNNTSCVIVNDRLGGKERERVISLDFSSVYLSLFSLFYYLSTNQIYNFGMSNQIYTTNMVCYILEITLISNEGVIKESEKHIFMKKNN